MEKVNRKIINESTEKQRQKLEESIKKLELVAKEKEEIRIELAVVAEKLRLKAVVVSENEKKLELVAKEKEEIRIKLVEVAKELRLRAKKDEIVSKKNEALRKELIISSKKLKLKIKELVSTAKIKDEIRRDLVVVAGDLATTAKNLNIISTEKEAIRFKLIEVISELEVRIQDQKHTQEEMNESEIRYRRLFETAHDGILILNSETGQITDVNQFLINLLGYTKEEFLDKKMWELSAFKNFKASKEAFLIIQKEGYVRYEDLPLEAKNGKLTDVEFVSNLYIAGTTKVIQCNIRDITERKKTELMKESMRLLEEEKLKVKSIADATHELRTPVAIIKGNVDLAIRRVGTRNLKDPKKALIAINHEVKHLSDILGDLSTITSKVWEVKDKIHYEKVDLRALISHIVHKSKILAYKKEISITATSIPKIYIFGDKIYLEKMFTNLVKNSIIYGHKKGHTVISAVKSDKLIQVNVADDGIGITEKDLPHVFDRFYRADSSRKADVHSVGLGLAIVKWVAEIHGGKVFAKQNNKKGSIFSVTLPIDNN